MEDQMSCLSQYFYSGPQYTLTTGKTIDPNEIKQIEAIDWDSKAENTDL
jgi:hypothetical protein